MLCTLVLKHFKDYDKKTTFDLLSRNADLLRKMLQFINKQMHMKFCSSLSICAH